MQLVASQGPLRIIKALDLNPGEAKRAPSRNREEIPDVAMESQVIPPIGWSLSMCGERKAVVYGERASVTDILAGPARGQGEVQGSA
jgi:hypothetical protein